MEMEIDGAETETKTAKEVFKAAELGEVSIFESLSTEQLSSFLSLRNDDGRSLLHVAVSSSHPKIVEIVAGVDSIAIEKVINCKDEEGWAPIHSASSIGNLHILHTLLTKGAEVNLKNDGGRTALHYAASKGRVKVAEMLLSNGADINVKDKVGCTPLHRAASTGNSELSELLIEEGAEIDVLDKAHQTPLMTAVICENSQVALLLVRHGANVDIEDREGYTVLGRAPKDLRDVIVETAKALMEG